MRSAENLAAPEPEGAGPTGHTKRRSRQGSGSGRLTQADLLAVVERQGGLCALTGRRLRPEIANIDHVVPLVRGGRHELENLQVVHKDANRMKGSLSNAEFVAICREVAAHADRATEAPAAETAADLEG